MDVTPRSRACSGTAGLMVEIAVGQPAIGSVTMPMQSWDEGPGGRRRQRADANKAVDLVRLMPD